MIKKFQHQNGWQDFILIWRSKKSDINPLRPICIVIYKCFQEDLMEGVIREEDREDREATKEDDIEYQIGLLGLVPPSGDLVE